MVSRRTEELVVAIMQMDRAELVETLRGFNCGFRMDFTDDFLGAISLDRLKHIVVAAGLQSERVAVGS